jgi:hypothetical protein
MPLRVMFTDEQALCAVAIPKAVSLTRDPQTDAP